MLMKWTGQVNSRTVYKRYNKHFIVTFLIKTAQNIVHIESNVLLAAVTARGLFLSSAGCEIHCHQFSDGSLAVSCRGEPGGSELHLSEGNRGVFTFPVYPDDSLYRNRTFGVSALPQKLPLFKILINHT